LDAAARNTTSLKLRIVTHRERGVLDDHSSGERKMKSDLTADLYDNLPKRRDPMLTVDAPV